VKAWIVSPAWQRFAVTELVLQEWNWLRHELAPRGWEVHAVLVADDDNLDLARAHGFDGLEHPNDTMGKKWNAGFSYAASEGADVFVYAGSDDWLHPSAFDEVPDGIVAFRSLDFVDLESGVLQHATLNDQLGTLPWLISRSALAGSNFQPMPPTTQRGSERALAFGLGYATPLKIRDCSVCVDFKTRDSVSPYAGVRNSTGDGVERLAWPELAERFPAHLVERARLLSEELQ